MALNVRRLADTAVFALVAVYNSWKREVTEQLATYPHADISSKPLSNDYLAPTSTPDIITAAVQSDLATGITLANQAKRVWNRHAADAVAHKAADATAVVSTADASDQATLNTLLNAMKGKFNAHVAEAGVHFTNDATYSITSANATDIASSQTLNNELKSDINNHIQFGWTAPSIKLVDA